MRSRSIVLVTLVVASIVLALSGVVAYRAGVTLADASDRLAHTKDVELTLEFCAATAATRAE